MPFYKRPLSNSNYSQDYFSFSLVTNNDAKVAEKFYS